MSLDNIPIDIRDIPRIDMTNTFVNCGISEIHWIYHAGLQRHIPSAFKHDAINTKFDLAKHQSELKNNGFTIVKNILPPGSCFLIRSAFFANNGVVYKTPEEETDRTASHNGPVSHLFHQLMAQLVSSIVPELIIPSYTFTSCYKKGTKLPMHIDSRPACTWNMSMMIDSSHPRLINEWPLVFGNSKHHRAFLNCGDGVIYSGTRTLHGRDQMPEPTEWALGLFCHFAPAEWKGSLD